MSGPTDKPTFIYRAFISYSHADKAWGDWLHKALETYRVPSRLVGTKTAAGVIPHRLHPIFRDRDELASAHDLGHKVNEALGHSEALIVICSPRSAQSRWVNEEVLTFKRLNRAERIFCLIVDGEPDATDKSDHEAEECFCPALRYTIDEHGQPTRARTEPIAADARPGKDGKANAKLKLIAGLLDVGFDQLKQREQHRKVQRLIALTSLALVVMAVTIVLAVYALISRHQAVIAQHAADNNAATASARLWASRRDAALRLQRDGDGFKALPDLISNVAEQERAGTGKTGVERREIGAILQSGVVLVNRTHLANAAKASPFAAELSPDGSRFALAMTDLTVHWFDTRTMHELGHVDLLGLPDSTDRPEIPVLLRFVDNQRLLVTLDWINFHPAPGTDDSYLIDLDAGKVVPFPDAFAGMSSATFNADGNYALLSDHAGRVQLWQARPWKPLSPLVAKGTDMDTTILSRDARHVYAIGSMQRTVAIYDSRTLANPERIALPTTQGISAWAESGNGTWLALGDFQGNLFLLDTRTGKVRQLRTPPGREVTWIAFSEDDAWVAAVRWDGSIYAFDAASGNPLNAGLMKQDFELRRVAINHRQRLLIASGLGKSGLWRLPQPSPTGREASRIITSPMRDATAGPYALGFSAKTGRLITAETDGEVRLWQAPATPVLDALPARQIPGGLEYDGKHVVDVQYNELRVASTIHGKPTPWVDLPQPVSFAELVDDGRTLVATSGTQLSVFDASTMRRRIGPIDLGDSPLSLAVNARSNVIAMAFPTPATVGIAERIESFDLRTGKLRAAPVVVTGPLQQFELSAEGTRLLATGSARAPTQVFDARTLRLIGAYRTRDGDPVIWASFQPHTDSLWVLSRAEDPRLLGNRVVSWNPRTGSILDSRAFSGVWAAGVIATLGKPFVGGRELDIMDPGKADERRIPSPTRDEVTSALAVSHDGHLIAHAFRYGVQLYDADTGALVGPMLHADLQSLDDIAQLAFSPADDQLLARTLQGRWVVWHVAKDSRNVASLQRDAELLDAAADTPVLREPTPAGDLSQAAIWSAPEPRPQIPEAGYVHGDPVPARAPGTSPLMLDLSPVYNTVPASRFSPMRAVMPGWDVLPLGVARIEGVDYDVRGAVQLQPTGAREAGIDFPPSVTGIPVPATPIAAFHVLLQPGMDSPVPNGDVEAQLRVHYRDGSVAVLPLRSGLELPGDQEQAQAVPAGWVHGDMLRLMGYTYQILLSNPRLSNPHPERLIASIDLVATNSTPAFFAVTAQPAIAPPLSGKAVSRSIKPVMSNTHVGRKP